jgi:predicted nucleotidyltransferase
VALIGDDLVGMLKVLMGISETLISEIVKRVVDVARPQRIILFGSAATGQMNRDSDIDLLVLESAPRDTRKESVRIHQAVRGLGYPFDIIVMAVERFEESKDVIGGIAYPANKYGKVIYEEAA